ncbi:MAG: hypothetical protein WDZ37_06340 [Solirubrobacterales bacterium]
MKRALPLLAAIALTVLAMAPTAPAQTVGEFGVALKDFKPSYGGYTAVLDARVYDSAGAAPSQLATAQIRLPRGAKIREHYVYGKFICNTVVLEVYMNPNTCRDSQFATGTMVLDARPGLAEPISTNIYLFLGAVNIDEVGQGAIARVAVFVAGTSAFRSQVLYGTLFRDSGPYSYRLVLPAVVTPLTAGLRLSLAELHLTVTGLKVTKPATGRHSARKVFWTSLPRCDKNGEISFGVDFRFSGAATIPAQRAVKCSKFLRRRSS